MRDKTRDQILERFTREGMSMLLGSFHQEQNDVRS